MKYLHLILGEPLPQEGAHRRSPSARSRSRSSSSGSCAIVNGAFTQGIDVAGADRLVVVNQMSIIQPLPLAYRDRLLRTPGVTAGDVRELVRRRLPGREELLRAVRDRPRAPTGEMFPEFVVPEEQWRGVPRRPRGLRGRRGARRALRLEGRRPHPDPRHHLPRRLGVQPPRHLRRAAHAGRRHPVLVPLGPTSTSASTAGKGLVGWYTVRIESPDAAATVAKAIDERFANSPYETKTDTEKAFAASFVKQMGNIELLMMTIGSVVFFTLLLVTGNTMAIAVRERTARAGGAEDRRLLRRVRARHGARGVAGRGGHRRRARARPRQAAHAARRSHRAACCRSSTCPPESAALGLALALGVGLVAGALPAISATRLKVVDALRRV